MSDASPQSADGPAPETPVKPTLRDRMKPVELLVMSAACGVFAGLVTLLVTRDWLLSGVMLGVAFIIALVVLAMLALGGYEPPAAPGERGVLGEKDAQRAALAADPEQDPPAS